MRKSLLGGMLATAVFGGALLAGVTGARASDTYEKATGLKCEQCHKQTKEEFEKQKITGFEAAQDLKPCGKESLDFLKKQAGFAELKPGQKRTAAETKKWAIALVKGRWKCSKQSAPGKPIP